MKEIEILAEVLDSKEKVIVALKKSKLKFIGSKKTQDVYFFDPKRKNLQMKNGKCPKEWFRIRKKDDESYITYKEDVFEREKWTHSHEYETKVHDFEVLKQIIKKLGFKELVTINNIKHTYESKDYEIVLEEVENLGLFLEVEKLNVRDDADINRIRKEIQEFIDSLGVMVKPDSNMGKPELLLKKRCGQKS